MFRTGVNFTPRSFHIAVNFTNVNFALESTSLQCDVTLRSLQQGNFHTIVILIVPLWSCHILWSRSAYCKGHLLHTEVSSADSGNFGTAHAIRWIITNDVSCLQKFNTIRILLSWSCRLGVKVLIRFRPRSWPWCDCQHMKCPLDLKQSCSNELMALVLLIINRKLPNERHPPDAFRSACLVLDRMTVHHPLHERRKEKDKLYPEEEMSHINKSKVTERNGLDYGRCFYCTFSTNVEFVPPRLRNDRTLIIFDLFRLVTI